MELLAPISIPGLDLDDLHLFTVSGCYRLADDSAPHMIGISYEGCLTTEEIHAGEMLFAVTLIRHMLKHDVLENHCTMPVGLLSHREKLYNQESVFN